MFYTKPWLDVRIVLLIVVLFLGPKRLPTLGRSLGEGLREFKDGITGGHKPDEDEEQPALTVALSENQAVAGEVVGTARERGVLTRALVRRTLQISPAFAITETEIATLVERLASALDAAEGSLGSGGPSARAS